ncbi:unnamed protein product [Cylicostephanus goldi]|uniref:CBS domain-containing protein n=1 Tax=Cylicostephanus goldi TaxID=71465 RepID=A0A3P6RUQ1_CYLGO|nr:unnamed protein product [Cylicostephanus goldi]
MATNNKVVVFTDDLSVRKAFYALVSNCEYSFKEFAHSKKASQILATRTGLVADSTTMNLTGVLSITDFTMVLMMLWKFRENIEEMKGTPLTQLQFNEMDIANMEIKRWKELLRKRGNQREFISVNTNERYATYFSYTKHLPRNQI